MSSTISRVLFFTCQGQVKYDHLSSLVVTNKLKRPTRKHSGSLYHFLLGLASDGVYICPFCYQKGGSLLHCHSTLTKEHLKEFLAVYFYCTSLGVASTGRYPASYPMKPGLSSPATFRHMQLRSYRPTHLLNYFITILKPCQFC